MRCPVKAAASIGRQDRLQGRCDNSETGLTVATVVALSIIIWDARCACDQSSHKDHKLGYVDNCWGGVIKTHPRWPGVQLASARSPCTHRGGSTTQEHHNSIQPPGRDSPGWPTVCDESIGDSRARHPSTAQGGTKG